MTNAKKVILANLYIGDFLILLVENLEDERGRSVFCCPRHVRGEWLLGILFGIVNANWVVLVLDVVVGLFFLWLFRLDLDLNFFLLLPV